MDPLLHTNPEEQTPMTLLPAATVIVIRDKNPGIDVLLVKKNSSLSFAGGMWVFPGGKVEHADFERTSELKPDFTAQIEPFLYLESSRYAAARETEEETQLQINPDALLPLSHWLPPSQSKKQFATWFFLAIFDEENVAQQNVLVDGGEIDDHIWSSPEEVFALHKEQKIELAPPTWVSLFTIRNFKNTTDVENHFKTKQPEFFDTHIKKIDNHLVALWKPDFEHPLQENPPERNEQTHHRLIMDPQGWRYLSPS